MTTDVLTASAPLAVLGLVVMVLGMRIRDKISTGVYRRGLRRLLAVLAVMLMIQFFLR